MYQFTNYESPKTEQRARYLILVYKHGEDKPIHHSYFNSREKAIEIACKCRHIFPKMNVVFVDTNTNEHRRLSNKEVRS